MRSSIRKIFLVLLGFAFVRSGVHAQTLHVGVSKFANELHPLLQQMGDEAEQAHLVWETLNKRDLNTGNAIAWLASLPILSSDGSALTYIVNPRARFSDGEKISARDILYSVFEYSNPFQTYNNKYRRLFADLQDVKIQGSDTITFYFSRFLRSRNDEMATMPVLPEHLLDPKRVLGKLKWSDIQNAQKNLPWMQKTRLDLEKHLRDNALNYYIGSGPYRILHLRDDEQSFEKDNGYWAKDIPSGKVNPDTIMYLKATGSEPLKWLHNGLLDISLDLRTDQYAALDTTRDHLHKLLLPTYSNAMIVWNSNDSILHDSRVRLGLSMLINYDLIVGAVLHDLVLRSNTVQYDTAEGMSLIRSAGWSQNQSGELIRQINGKEEPFSLILLVEQGDHEQISIGLALHQTLKRFGIEVQVLTMERQELMASVTSGKNIQAAFLTEDFNPSEKMEDYFIRPGAYDYSQLRDSIVSAAVTEWEKSTTSEAARVAKEKAFSRFAADMPFALLYRKERKAAANEKFHFAFSNSPPYFFPEYSSSNR